MKRRVVFTGKKFSMWILVLPLVFYFLNVTGFPYSSLDAEFSDYTITHFPNIIYLKQSLLNGHFPLWSSSIFSGYPFFANPLSGLWYFPGWVALIFPLPMGTNILAALHLLFGGVGVYKLLRDEGVGHLAALFGGIVFEFLPKIVSHYGAGHLTLIYAVPWTPWLLLSARGLFKEKQIRSLCSPIILALICLADVRWVVYAGSLWAIYYIAHRYRNDETTPLVSTQIDKINWMLQKFPKIVKAILWQLLLAILLSGPVLVPLYEYSQLSTRALITSEESLDLALPIINLIGFLFPNFGGNHEYMVYSGSGILIFAILSLIIRKKSREIKFWQWTGVITLLLAVDLPFSFSRILFSLPFINLLRVPSRVLFITCLSMIALSSHFINILINNYHKISQRKTNIVLIILNGAAISFTFGLIVIVKENSISFIVGALFMLSFSLWLLGRTTNRVPIMFWFTGLVLISIIDLGILNQSLLSFKSQADVVNEKRLVIDYLVNQEGDFRVYSPSYSVPQHIGMLNGIQLVDGVDPLQIAKYSEFMELATGVTVQGYNVSIPPFETGNPESDNLNYVPDLEFLGLLNTRYIISEFNIHASGFHETNEFDGSKIYQNNHEFPRAWVQKSDSVYTRDYKNVEIISYGPNKIEIQGSGPGQLVLSEIDYPGWQVRIDGKKTDIEVFLEIFRSVHLPEGNHSITFLFRPSSLYIGILSFAIGMFTILIYVVIVSRKRDSLDSTSN